MTQLTGQPPFKPIADFRTFATTPGARISLKGAK